MKRTALALTAAAMALTATLTYADGHAAHNSAIKARQGQMNLYNHNLGVLGGMAKGDIEYDAAVAQIAADNIVAAASINGMNMWPEGSDNGSVEGTRAKPELWQNFPDVIAKATAATEAANAMAAAASTDLDALRGAMGPLGAACTACHREYRSR
ncbi:cytochrome c [Cognatishimia sp. SS12]|uniref:c-type cytochrome n=1 Tax=Cognatishimia sp. SS12 TaxID=2979465 RepID=UPI00232B9B32|nr:cytochrome c [Cognatishimia sp. SS12]MDC0737106.1 cytochrome c [Cognatishimia sp. SS12]